MTTISNNLIVKKAEELQLEDAVALAQDLERYEQAVKVLKDKLKAYVELNGPVSANNKVWDFFESSSWEFEPDRLKALAGMMAIDGHNPFQYLTLSSSSLKKLNFTDEMLTQYGEKRSKSKTFRSVLAKNYTN